MWNRTVALAAVCGLGAILLAGAARPAWAGDPAVREVRLAATYLPLGGQVKGTVVVNVPPGTAKDARLKITALRQIDVPESAKVSAGLRADELANMVLESQAADREVTFELKPAGMLTGTIQVKAEIAPAKDQPAVSAATSALVTVGVRQRLDLAGNWPVVAVEQLKFEDQWRPKDWKLPEAPKTMRLPGTFDAALTGWFRGWVTLKREIEWQAPAGLQPRFFRIAGVWDSALVTVDGAKIGEVAPVEEMDVLTHWLEYHSQFKGEENRLNRMMMKDHDEYLPMTMALAKPLPAAGKTTVELKVRGTSGMWRPKPAYGVQRDLCLELAPAVCVKDVTFDTEKPGDLRRFKFSLAMVNDGKKEFRGKLRIVYGQYQGPRSYTGACPAYATMDQPLVLPSGASTVLVTRDEVPRFATCRATFLVVAGDQVTDAASVDFHTVSVEIRDRRDLYLNNERFIVKGRGSSSQNDNERWQLRINGVNVIRGPTVPAHIEELLANGLLTSAGGALLASCERCTFWNPKDTSNITRAVKEQTRALARYPGVIEWEATNELFGEPEECRVAIAEAFHQADPYHRPVLMTKGGGEWEAEAKEGRVAGPDIIGVQYLGTKEGIDSVTASITEQPMLCSEINWNDGGLMQNNIWPYWLEKGLCGALLFDYSGNSTDQGVPLIPPGERETDWSMIKESHRAMYQDLVATAVQRPDGRLTLSVANRMPYVIRRLTVKVRGCGRLDVPDLAPGDAADLALPAGTSPGINQPVMALAEYQTHAGLPHVAALTPTVTAAPAEGGAK